MTTQPKTRDFRRMGGTLAAALGLLLAPLAAHAQITLNFLPAVQTVSAGNSVTFSGTITNAGTAGVYLTGDTFSLNGQGLTVDDTLFLNATSPPILLAGGASYPLSGTADLFTVAADATVIAGSINVGTFNIEGGATSTSTDTLTSQKFTVQVPGAPVPEASLPVSFGLLLLGGVGVLAVRRRKPAAAAF